MAYFPFKPAQQPMSSSLGVVIANDQSPVSVTGTVAANQSGTWTTGVSSLISVPGIISTANSSTATLGGGAVFTGTSEDVKDFGSITVSVFTDQASATDGLSIQQSSNGTNWDITDVYTIAASTGKTFSVQPAARFFRIVYTNGATPQGALRLQTVYHPIATKASSQRPADGYTNETDLEQNQAFDMMFNGTTWDRVRGATATGLFVNVTASVATRPGPASVSGVGIFNTNPIGNGSVFAVLTNSSVTALQGTNPWNVTGSVYNYQAGTTITSISGTITIGAITSAASIIGTYQEDSASATGDRGLFTLGVRNDTMSSVTSADGDYSATTVGPTGEMVVANSPITKWVSGQTSVMYGTSVQAIAPQGASIFTYITGIQIANPSANNSLIKLTGGLGSVLGWTMAPANGGSNIVFPNALKTGENSGFSASISGVSSVYVTVTGFISKT